MNMLSDQEFAETEAMLRQRLAQLADHAPTAVQLPGEVPVVALGSRRHNRRRMGVIATVTALIGAGSFTTYSFLAAGNHGGAATPEEAVTAFVSAVEHEDVLGMIDVTLPEEVGVLTDAVESITADAKRIDVLGADFDAAGVRGIDISVDDLALETNFLEGGLATVTATSGTVDASFDPQAFPFGDRLRALLGDAESGGGATSETIGGTDPPALLMTVERGGRWYVSVEYTIAEYVRRAAGWELPGPVNRSPIGFDSPESAVNAFYDRLAALDLQGAMDSFAPGEDALAWLAQSWMPDAAAAIERGRADGWSVAISGLTYETVGDGSHRTLQPLTYKVEATIPAGVNKSGSEYADPSKPTLVWAFDGSGYAIAPPGQVPATTAELSFTPGSPADMGDSNFTSANPNGTITPLVFAPEPSAGPQHVTIDHADGCTTYTGDAVQTTFGLAGSSMATPVDGGFQICGRGPFGGLSLLLLAGGFPDLPAVSVVESGGKWYVSPLGTALASISTSLHDVKDGASLFDSALAPFFYGGMSRSVLEPMIVGQAADSIAAECLPALTVDNGAVTGFVTEPALDAVWACATGSSYDSATSESGGGVFAPVPESVVPATTTP